MVELRSRKKYCILASIWLAIAIAVALLIIHFTGEPASVSDQTSKGVLYRLLEFIGIEPTDEVLSIYNHYIRKAAHFILFFAFGFSLRAAAQYQRKLPKMASALIVGGLFAIGDELRQNFIPGRAPGIKDVVIDFAGVLLGALAVTGLFHLAEKRRKRRASLGDREPAAAETPRDNVIAKE